MSESEPNQGYRISRTLAAIDREIRRQSRRHAGEEEIASFEHGGAGTDQGPDDRNDDDRFVMERLIENAPVSTHARLLLTDGISLPSPESLGNGKEIQAKLWEVIDALAARRVYLKHTNHLTNRELYSALWTIHLNELARDLSNCPGASWHIDLLDCSTARDDRACLNDHVMIARRKFWSEDSDREEAPNRWAPAYDRDRHLPRRG